MVLEYLPGSSQTVRKWIMDEYKWQKETKKEVLRHSRSQISISFDTWTSSFCKKHVLSMIAHFVDENWERQHLQLSMCWLYGGYSGANVATHILPILSDWEISNRIGYFITDNEYLLTDKVYEIDKYLVPLYKIPIAQQPSHT